MNHWNVFLGSSTFEVAIFIAPPTSRQAFPANLPALRLPFAFPEGSAEGSAEGSTARSSVSKIHAFSHKVVEMYTVYVK